MAQVVGKVTVGGVEFQVSADVSGTFWLTNTEQAIHGNGMTLDAAKASVRKQLAKSKISVEVPFVVVQRDGGGMKYRRGVARGLHVGRSSDVLVTYEDGSKGTVEYGADVWAADTPDEVLTAYIRHETVAREEQQRARRLQRDHKLVLAQEVRRVIDAVAEKVA